MTKCSTLNVTSGHVVNTSGATVDGRYLRFGRYLSDRKGKVDQRWKSELEALLESQRLARSSRLRQLLVWLVTRAAEGRLDLLNEYDAAQALKGNADHDPAVHSDIRKLLSRLRKVLRDYYNTEGRTRPCNISLPGGFEPRLLVVSPRSGPAAGELVVHFESLHVVTGTCMETAHVFESELLYQLGMRNGILVRVGAVGQEEGTVLSGRIWGRDSVSAVLQLIETRTKIICAQARVEIAGDIAAAATRAVESLCLNFRPQAAHGESDG